MCYFEEEKKNILNIFCYFSILFERREEMKNNLDIALIRAMDMYS